MWKERDKNHSYQIQEKKKKGEEKDRRKRVINRRHGNREKSWVVAHRQNEIMSNRIWLKLQLHPPSLLTFPLSPFLSFQTKSKRKTSVHNRVTHTHFQFVDISVSFSKCVRWGWSWYSSPPLWPASSSSETSSPNLNPTPTSISTSTSTTTSLRIPTQLTLNPPMSLLFSRAFIN